MKRLKAIFLTELLSIRVLYTTCPVNGNHRGQRWLYLVTRMKKNIWK